MNPDEDSVVDLRPLIEADSKNKLKSSDVGDWVWPTDNEMAIPLLLKDVQPRGLELPTNRWGARARRDRVEGGTYHFYTDDYRFESLWKNPAPVVNSGCNAVAETNFSTNSEMPFPVFLWHLYRKRWLARYWQSYNIEIWADLAVAPRYLDFALLGIPKGWRAYATYSFGSHGIEKVEAEAALAEERAGGEILLWVVCGEESDLEICQDHGWIGTPAHQQAYLRNVGGKKAVRYSEEPTATAPSKTLLDFAEVR
ncbi:MAG: DUF4417 domain-containing protein [Methanothrix harundinacea]|nr:DUF4417 domain-containing protein [Methanothrix harundinacea]